MYNIELIHQIYPLVRYVEDLLDGHQITVSPSEYWIGSSETYKNMFQVDDRNTPTENAIYIEFTLNETRKVRTLRIQDISYTGNIRVEWWGYAGSSDGFSREITTNKHDFIIDLGQDWDVDYMELVIEKLDETTAIRGFVFNLGYYEIFDSNSIESLTYVNEENITGVNYPISTLTATINKTLNDASKDTLWECRISTVVSGRGFYTLLAPYSFNSIDKKENNNYELVLYAATSLFKKQEVNESAIKTFQYIKNNYLKNTLLITPLNGNTVGNYNNKTMLDACVQNALTSNDIAQLNGNMTEAWISRANNLYTIDSTMVNPTEATPRYECFIGGKLEQQQKLDSIVIYYSTFTDDGNGNYTETETSETYNNPETTVYTNIKKINKIQVETSQANRQALANSLFTYYKYQIYKGKVWGVNPVKAGQVYTFETEYGLIRGVILKSVSYITQTSIVSDIQMLAMRIVNS